MLRKTVTYWWWRIASQWHKPVPPTILSVSCSVPGSCIGSVFLKWSLITASSPMGNTFLVESAEDIQVAWVLTLQVRDKAKGYRINVFSFITKSSIPFNSGSSFCYQLFIAVLVTFLINLNSVQTLASLTSFLCTWTIPSLVLLSPSLLIISVYFHFVFVCSQEFAVQPSWPPATPAVSSLLALWADVPRDHCCALPFKRGLLMQDRDEDHSISTVLLEEEFILMFPNPLNSKQVR